MKNSNNVSQENTGQVQMWFYLNYFQQCLIFGNNSEQLNSQLDFSSTRTTYLSDRRTSDRLT